MSSDRHAVDSRQVLLHTCWSAAWTGLFVALAVFVGGDRPGLWWWLVGVPGLLGLWHLLFQVGRWADRRGSRNALSRKASRSAWVLPVALPVFVLLDAVAL